MGKEAFWRWGFGPYFGNPSKIGSKALFWALFIVFRTAGPSRLFFFGGKLMTLRGSFSSCFFLQIYYPRVYWRNLTSTKLWLFYFRRSGFRTADKRTEKEMGKEDARKLRTSVRLGIKSYRRFSPTVEGCPLLM